MAGRPRLYQNTAEKMCAYRERQAQRTVKMDRITQEQLQAHLQRLREAVYSAQDRSDPLALSLRTTMETDMLTDLALYFETGVIPVRPNRTRANNRVK